MSKSIGMNFEDMLVNLQDINLTQFKALQDVWISTYGRDCDETQESMSAVKKSLQDFWIDQIEIAEGIKTNLMEDIEFMGMEAVELERILKLPQKVKELDNEIPLLLLKRSLEDLVKSYRELGSRRVQDYEEFRKQEEDLCNFLDENIKIQPLPGLDGATSHKANRTVTREQTIPSDDKLQECRARVEELRMLEASMREEFSMLKEEIKILFQECETKPLGKYERGIEENDAASVTFSTSSLKKLRESVENLRSQKRDLIVDAEHLRSEITKLAKKLMKEPRFLESLFVEFSGFGQKTASKLRQVLAELKSERKYKLKELILQHREMLADLWSKCHYSDNERSQFRAYYADHFSEDILTLHELEVERLELFYNQHKRIFLLANKHKELWDRLLHLEQEASSTQRLFTNRGGRLLMEEKERKTIQKKLPAVKAELVTLLNQFKAENGFDFLEFGVPLIDALERLEEEREAAKENEKRQRLQPPPHSTMVTPGRIGVGAAAGSYVMRHTPQMLQVPVPRSCNVTTTPGRTEAPRTPAASTPKNGDASRPNIQQSLSEFD